MKKLISLLAGGVLLFGAATLGTQAASARERQDRNNAQNNRRDNDRNNDRNNRRHHRRHRHHRHRRNKLSY